MNKQRMASVVSSAGIFLFTLVSGYTAFAHSSNTNRSTVNRAETVLTAQLSGRFEFFPPLDEGTPRRTRGAATRDPSCDALQVLPEQGWGLTTEARPMVQAYFKSGVEKVWMQLASDDGTEVYSYSEEQYFILPEEKGFVEIPLPDAVSGLTPNKRYHWSIVLLCNAPFGPSSPVITGGIQRVDVVVPPAEIASMSLREQASVYAESGLWYDFVSTLTLMRSQSPQNTQIEMDWESALRAVNLDVIFDEFEAVE